MSSSGSNNSNKTPPRKRWKSEPDSDDGNIIDLCTSSSSSSIDNIDSEDLNIKFDSSDDELDLQRHMKHSVRIPDRPHECTSATLSPSTAPATCDNTTAVAADRASSESSLNGMSRSSYSSTTRFREDVNQNLNDRDVSIFNEDYKCTSSPREQEYYNHGDSNTEEEKGGDDDGDCEDSNNDTREWTDILSHDLSKKQFEVKWCGRKYPTLESIETFCHTVSDINVVLLYMEEVLNPTIAIHNSPSQIQQQNEEGEWSKWMTEVQDFKAALELHVDMNETLIEEKNYGICCCICNCSEEKRSNNIINSSNSGNDQIWHRWCCHNITGLKNSEDWLSPLKKAIEKSTIASGSLSSDGSGNTRYTRQDLNQQVIYAERKEKEFCNRHIDGSIDGDSMIYTDPVYSQYCLEFKEIKSRNQYLGPAVVLEMFCGLGSGTIVLKKLSIDMKKVIHVDHDPVAIHVCRFNHDSQYNKNLPNDGITYVYDYKTFEEINEHLDSFMMEHGPIDIILGGPPCSDYSQVNATRLGTSGVSGQYLPEFGKFIKRVRNHEGQKGRPLFFLSENVIFREFDCIDVITKAYGFPFTVIDAQQFSPCRRNRVYWVSLPMGSTDNEETQITAEVSASSILEDGWMLPAQVSERTANCVMKVNTLMASKSKIDDIPRMLKVRENEDGYFEMGTFTVTEREKMLGIPIDYVNHAVNDLYKNLTEAYLAETIPGAEWKSRVDEKYHHFAGCKLGVKAKPGEFPYFDVTIRPPKGNLKNAQEAYTSEEYSKRLLGNGWSIPVIDHLLSPLQQIFSKRKYEGYDYSFSWPPYNCS